MRNSICSCYKKMDMFFVSFRQSSFNVSSTSYSMVFNYFPKTVGDGACVYFVSGMSCFFIGSFVAKIRSEIHTNNERVVQYFVKIKTKVSLSRQP